MYRALLTETLQLWRTCVAIPDTRSHATETGRGATIPITSGNTATYRCVVSGVSPRFLALAFSFLKPLKQIPWSLLLKYFPVRCPVWLEQRSSDFDNFWHKWFWYDKLSNNRSSSYFTQCIQCILRQRKTSEIYFEINRKINKSHYRRILEPKLPAEYKVYHLTVVQQCVYKVTFRNIDEFKKRLVKSGLVWSRTLSTLLSMNRKSVLVSVFVR